MTARPCTRCHGTGIRKAVFQGEPSTPCPPCKGRGNFPALDIEGITSEVFTKKTKDGKRTFRKSYTSTKGFDDLHKARAYYVWRLTRFHGGADVTMPVTAGILVWGDPYKPELDALAEVLAKAVYGTNMAAAFHAQNIPIRKFPGRTPASS